MFQACGGGNYAVLSFTLPRFVLKCLVKTLVESVKRLYTDNVSNIDNFQYYELISKENRE
jgi:hypothetical protein